MTAFLGAAVLPAAGGATAHAATTVDAQTPYAAANPQRVGSATLGAGGTYTLTLANVPAGATTVNLSLAAARATAATTVKMCPGATVSTGCVDALSTIPGATKNVGVVATLGGPAGNQVTFQNTAGSTALYVYLHGYSTSASVALPSDAFYRAVTPAAVMSNQAVAAQATYTLTLPGVPAGATAVAMSLSSSSSTVASYVAACPADQAAAECSATSVLSPAPGTTPSNSVVLKLGGAAHNQVKFYNNAGTSVLGASVSGYYVTPTQPNAANTGVPVGTALSVNEGDLTITVPNTVVDGKDIHGFLNIKATNVTVKNTIVRGRSYVGGRGIVSVSAGASVTIQDSEISPTTASPYFNGITGSNFTLRRVDINHVVDSVRIQGDNVLIENSWLHDNVHYEVDPTQSNTPSHDDGIQIEMGNHIYITGNTLTDPDNVGIMVGQNLGLVTDLKIQRNYLDGGGCTVNLSEKGRGPIYGTNVSDNSFGRNTKVLNCPIISPSTTTAVLTATGNTYADDGSVAPVRKG